MGHVRIEVLYETQLPHGPVHDGIEEIAVVIRNRHHLVGVELDDRLPVLVAQIDLLLQELTGLTPIFVVRRHHVRDTSHPRGTDVHLPIEGGRTSLNEPLGRVELVGDHAPKVIEAGVGWIGGAAQGPLKRDSLRSCAEDFCKARQGLILVPHRKHLDVRRCRKPTLRDELLLVEEAQENLEQSHECHRTLRVCHEEYETALRCARDRLGSVRVSGVKERPLEPLNESLISPDVLEEIGVVSGVGHIEVPVDAGSIERLKERRDERRERLHQSRYGIGDLDKEGLDRLDDSLENFEERDERFEDVPHRLEEVFPR